MQEILIRNAPLEAKRSFWYIKAKDNKITHKKIWLEGIEAAKKRLKIKEPELKECVK